MTPGIHSSTIDLRRRVVQAKLLIDAHYAAPLSLDRTADEACFSKFHFIRLFRSVYGRTPHQYLMRVRMAKARELLQQGLPVGRVCLEVGFESFSSFTRLFRQQNGCTPSVYARKQRLRRQQIRQEPLAFIPGCFLRMLE